jgi:hypothetical protein
MGTSQSSAGSPPGVPMVPPWVPPPPASEGEPGQPPENGDASPDGPAQANAAPPESAGRLESGAVTSPMAPSGRFRGARQGLGSFVETGDARAMRRGVGHYVRTGYGGAPTAIKRFGGTIASANALYAALTPSGAGGGVAAEAAIEGKTAAEVRDALIESVRPVDGTLDAESTRAALSDAWAELLERFPEADLANLTDEQRLVVVERFVANDVFRRLELDVGQAILAKAQTAAIAVTRLAEIREYVQQTVATAFRERALRSGRVTQQNIASVVRDALRRTFTVFEEYLK